jgi:hypothetical protein
VEKEKEDSKKKVNEREISEDAVVEVSEEVDESKVWRS